MQAGCRPAPAAHDGLTHAHGPCMAAWKHWHHIHVQMTSTTPTVIGGIRTRSGSGTSSKTSTFTFHPPFSASPELKGLNSRTAWPRRGIQLANLLSQSAATNQVPGFSKLLRPAFWSRRSQFRDVRLRAVPTSSKPYFWQGARMLYGMGPFGQGTNATHRSAFSH